VQERLGIVGSGAIACGLATVAAPHGEVRLHARSEASAKRARETISDAQVHVTCDLGALADRSVVVEAIVEDHDAKARLLAALDERLEAEAILATTTSSLSVTALAAASGRPDRFAGLHVFNPVARVDLVELAFPAGSSDATRTRFGALCATLGKTAIEVPDIPGFVVNRLLFPYLFSAVTLLEETGLEPEQIDTCMKLGAAHPLGPLAVLDLVGLDVAVAIGDEIGVPVPARVRELAAAGTLGRKTGHGFHAYPPRT